MGERPVPEQPGMVDYGVGGPGWSGLPWSWAAERLVPNRNYWVGTVSASGRPHSLPVWGVWDDDDLRFMFSCGPRSRKARNLVANPHVVVTIDDTVECVSVEGVARVLDPSDPGVDTWVSRYLAKYRPVSWSPHSSMSTRSASGRSATIRSSSSMFDIDTSSLVGRAGKRVSRRCRRGG